MDNTELYSQWTATKKFHVGDSLVFEYKNDSVLVVSKWGYYHCDTTKPSSVFIDGNTTLVLDNPGEFYFISGDPSHCKEGQRLFINVLPLHRYIATDPVPFPANSPAPSLPTKSGSSAVSVTVVSLIVAPAMWLVFSEVYFISKISNSPYLV
ncbi:hypothetical protein Leryth_026527 [Lithospermum erythrorhizon]|nr:hypothetical protein Leryth_026527 [Lithospermum erythrorhizon]